MASLNTTVINSDNTSSTATAIIHFNPASQLPIKLTGSHNFTTWKVQLSLLMHGHNLFGHLDGSTPSPSKTTTTNNETSPNPAYNLWFRQDELIQNAILASVDPTLASIIANAPTAQRAWESLHTAFANKSQTRVISLQDQLAKVSKSSRLVANYLTEIRAIADELATASFPITKLQLMVQILQVLGPEYAPIAAALRSRNAVISYEELYEQLTDHELFLKNEEAKQSPSITAAIAQRSTPTSYRNTSLTRWSSSAVSQQHWRSTQPRDLTSSQWQSRRYPNTSRASDSPIYCQLCDTPGHTARICRTKSHNHIQARANFATHLPHTPH